MADYPSSIKTFTNPTATNEMTSPSHSTQHSDVNDETNAIETELGTTPSGTYASVAVRLSSVEATAIVGSTHSTADGSSHSIVVANSGTIAANVSAIATNNVLININSTGVATNAATIVINATAISTNAADILTNSAGVATNVTQAAIGVDHSTANGSSHSYINQSVVSGASPTFTGSNFTGIPGTALELASEAEGDIMYFDGSDWVRLAIGASGEVLTANAGTTAPEWAVASAGVSATFETYTPTAVCSVSGSFVAGADDTWQYYRVGDLVGVGGRLTVTAGSGTISGALRISLPFAVATGSAGSDRTALETAFSGHGGTYNDSEVFGNVSTAGAYLTLSNVDVTGGNVSIKGEDIGTAWSVQVGGTYIATTA